MTKEEAKQYIRNQIDSSLKILVNKNAFYLCYNKSYLRALKLSKITGNIVNKENFNGSEKLFWVNTKNKIFWYYDKIRNYLNENYSKVYIESIKIVEEVFNEYEEYKDYKYI